MTIYGLDVIYGFKVHKNDYIALYGYDKLPQHIIDTYTQHGYSVDIAIHEIMHEGCEGINDGKALWDNYNSTQFVINGVQYKVMEYPHDRKQYKSYYIVGVHKGYAAIGQSSVSTSPLTYNGLNPNALTISSIQTMSYKLAQANIPFDVVTMITDYLETTDDQKCEQLLKDPKWAKAIKEEHNGGRRLPQLYAIPDDCTCCS